MPGSLGVYRVYYFKSPRNCLVVILSEWTKVEEIVLPKDIVRPIICYYVGPITWYTRNVRQKSKV
jgi:hypothetical protein